MRIEGDTLMAKSVEPYYTQEHHGDKPNTLRLVHAFEAEEIMQWVKEPRDRFIEIHLADSYGSFRRTITFLEMIRIPKVKLPVNHHLLMICWRP